MRDSLGIAERTDLVQPVTSLFPALVPETFPRASAGSFADVVQWLLCRAPEWTAPVPAVHVELVQVAWTESVPTILASPGGGPNTYLRPNRARSPGWIAQLHTEWSETAGFIRRDVLASYLIHATEGSSCGRHSFSTLHLFAEDWPSLACMARLKGEHAYF